MFESKRYSANLTGAWFLFYEIKQVLKLKRQGDTDSEIKEKVFSENLFQHKTKSSVARAFPSVLMRANALSEDLQNLILEDSAEVGKLLNVLAIMKTDLLFTAFMREIVEEKYESGNLHLERRDINMFFTQKSEQDENLAKWTINTINKLRQVYLKILLESDIMLDLKTGELRRIFWEDHVLKILRDSEEYEFINMFKIM